MSEILNVAMDSTVSTSNYLSIVIIWVYMVSRLAVLQREIGQGGSVSVRPSHVGIESKPINVGSCA